MFEDVKIGPSPLWLKQRLMAAGQRPISNVVDITNYVMLTTGQPLHAFDLDKVRGRSIVVRRAREGETMTTLDGVERTFSSDMALVCDAEGPSGIAGVMGGDISEVSDSTTRVLMEAATWVGPNIMRTSKALGLRTRGVGRFEKQLHPEQAIAAQRLAARLMVELCGARMVPGTIDATRARPASRGPLRAERMERLLGSASTRRRANGILERLGFELLPDTGWVVPPWRYSDVRREVDLIEEVARIHGLDKLPTTLPGARATPSAGSRRSQRLRRRLEDLLRDRGLLETVSYSSPRGRAGAAAARRRRAASAREPAQRGPQRDAPAPAAGPAGRGQHNAAHGRAGVRLFESAHATCQRAARAAPRAPRRRTRRRTSATTWRAPHGGRRRRAGARRRTPADLYAVKGAARGA